MTAARIGRTPVTATHLHETSATAPGPEGHP